MTDDAPLELRCPICDGPLLIEPDEAECRRGHRLNLAALVDHHQEEVARALDAAIAAFERRSAALQVLVLDHDMVELRDEAERTRDQAELLRSLVERRHDRERSTTGSRGPDLS